MSEQDLYRTQGLEGWKDISFRDNQNVIDLIGGTRFVVINVLEAFAIMYIV